MEKTRQNIKPEKSVDQKSGNGSAQQRKDRYNRS